MNNTIKVLDLKVLEQVSGGGLFSAYTDENYAKAGIEVVGPGWFYNDGYRYNGQDISMDEANWLTYYYVENHRRASSIDEAKRYFEATSDDCDNYRFH